MKLKTRIPALLCASTLLCLGATAQAADDDRDQINNLLDNCLTIPNPQQLDSDADGFGNACDTDLNNDLITDQRDMALFLAAQKTQAPNADFNSDGEVNELDMAILESFFEKPPGPSNTA